MIDLEIRVRGYLTQLLQACPLSEDQRWKDEPDGSDYHIRIHAHLPQTGQLLRWLLGAGDNLEVIQPEALRQTMAEQARKMVAIYEPC